MTDAFDDRRRALEDEYIHKKDQEAIEKLQHDLADAVRAKERAAGVLRCPRCDYRLTETTFEGLTVQHCEQCKGWWLDAGELEQLTHHEGGIVRDFLRSLGAE